MRKSRASRTAMSTAAVRAIESEKPSEERICYDPLARQFASPIFYHALRLLAAYGEQRTHGALTFIVCRCRYIDDYLQDCLNSGTVQVVILGAGLDSRAYREPLSKAVASTFEVDHPATQMDKIRRVKRVLGREPANLTWVPLDFNAGTLDILFDFRFDRQRKTLFILEGLVPYLEAKAVDTTLGWIRAHAAPGSAIILDYQQASPLARRDRTYAVLSRASGEARAFVIPRGQSSYFLSRLGFAHIVEALAEDLKRLYCRGPNAGRAVSEDYAIVRAEIPA